MYEYINGNLTNLTPTDAVIETGGIGYFIHISLTTFSSLQGMKSARLFLHQIVREDAHLLFGFHDLNERLLFRYLISVNGVGSNSAIMMLSSYQSEELQKAIFNENVSLLKSIKGIGAKTAQKIIIELKDKVGKGLVSDRVPRFEDHKPRNEAITALETLGFNKKLVEKLVDQIVIERPDISVEGLIKLALKSF